MTTTIIKRRRPYSERIPGSLTAYLSAQADYDKAMVARANWIKEHGKEMGEFEAGVDYDINQSEPVTGRFQLLRCGIIPVPPQELHTRDEIWDELWTVIEGLAESGVYLINTNHLSDIDLYSRLYYRILNESMRLVPHRLAAEYVDCLHPMDQYHARGIALNAVKVGAADLVGQPGKKYGRGPVCLRSDDPAVLHDRDQWLPMPTDEGGPDA